MPILMKAEVIGQTQQGYEAVFEELAPLYKNAPGFIAHLSHPIDGGWCVMDIWSSREDFQTFFSLNVAHRLSPTLRPKIAFQLLHDVLAASAYASTDPEDAMP